MIATHFVAKQKIKNPLETKVTVMKNEMIIVPAPTADNFAMAMGIGAKREEQLCDLIGKCYDSTDTYPLAIVCIADQVENVNELAYALFHLGAYAGNVQARQTLIKRLEE